MRKSSAIMLIASCAFMEGAAPPLTAAPQLTMSCHELLNGEPMGDPTEFFLIGSDLFTKAAGQVVRISTAGKPLFLSHNVSGGISTSTWAEHFREGFVISRRVYWKRGSGPRRVRYTERYHFRNQVLKRSDQRGDACHHDGR